MTTSERAAVQLSQTDEVEPILLKTLGLLQDIGPRHPGLSSHLYQSMQVRTAAR